MEGKRLGVDKFRADEKQKMRDKNGCLRSISIGQNRKGIFITFYYDTGTVSHFIPKHLVLIFRMIVNNVKYSLLYPEGYKE